MGGKRIPVAAPSARQWNSILRQTHFWGQKTTLYFTTISNSRRISISFRPQQSGLRALYSELGTGGTCRYSRIPFKVLRIPKICHWLRLRLPPVLTHALILRTFVLEFERSHAIACVRNFQRLLARTSKLVCLQQKLCGWLSSFRCRRVCLCKMCRPNFINEWNNSNTNDATKRLPHSAYSTCRI